MITKGNCQKSEAGFAVKEETVTMNQLLERCFSHSNERNRGEYCATMVFFKGTYKTWLSKRISRNVVLRAMEQ
jgi:hypothetical protein